VEGVASTALGSDCFSTAAAYYLFCSAETDLFLKISSMFYVKHEFFRYFCGPKVAFSCISSFLFAISVDFRNFFRLYKLLLDFHFVPCKGHLEKLILVWYTDDC